MQTKLCTDACMGMGIDILAYEQSLHSMETGRRLYSKK